MKTISAIAFASLLFSVPVSFASHDFDIDTGTTVDSDYHFEAQNTQTCTLSMPTTVINGEVFKATVEYDPITPGGGSITEILIFRWPTRCNEFTEKTFRVKDHLDTGSISGSEENVVVPSALCIAGTFKAIVRVRGTVNCVAEATMTIINP